MCLHVHYISTPNVGKRPSLTTTETTKKVATIHTHYNFFFTTAKIFSTILYTGNDIFGKIVLKIVVVCEGLNRYLLTKY